MRRNPYPLVLPAEKIPRLKRFLARLHPIPYLVDDRHFSRPTTVYLAYCKQHKIYFLDYPHGYEGYLWCPECLRERLGGEP